MQDITNTMQHPSITTIDQQHSSSNNHKEKVQQKHSGVSQQLKHGVHQQHMGNKWM